MSPYRAFQQNLKVEYRKELEEKTEIHPDLNSCLIPFFVPSNRAMNKDYTEQNEEHLAER